MAHVLVHNPKRLYSNPEFKPTRAGFNKRFVGVWLAEGHALKDSSLTIRIPARLLLAPQLDGSEGRSPQGVVHLDLECMEKCKHQDEQSCKTDEINAWIIRGPSKGRDGIEKGMNAYRSHVAFDGKESIRPTDEL